MIFHVPPEDPPACPKCAAAIQRAEQAEAMCEAWRLNCESATRLLAELQLDRIQLRKDLAAARRERDALLARLESAEQRCQLPSMDGTITACACCGAIGNPSRGSKPEHAADCPFAALGAAGERSEDG